nr:DUF2381 family protein [Corallococcus coralloides]
MLAGTESTAQPRSAPWTGGVRVVELPEAPSDQEPEIVISPGLSTTFTFDAELSRRESGKELVDLERREVFSLVDFGQTTLRLTPSDKLASGARLRLSVRFLVPGVADGPDALRGSSLTSSSSPGSGSGLMALCGAHRCRASASPRMTRRSCWSRESARARIATMERGACRSASSVGMSLLARSSARRWAPRRACSRLASSRLRLTTFSS